MIFNSLQIDRILHISDNFIKKLDLRLDNYNVLTEVGSNYYLFTPILAALAGANEVMAWTKDSVFGNGAAIINDCNTILNYLGMSGRVDFFNGRSNADHLKKADIITNSGFLRPLDEDKLKLCKEGIAIPLMYEKWELRMDDIDLTFCTKRKIKVAGTWEDHPDIKVFSYVGLLAIRLAIEAGYEIYNNKIIVWSDDNFGEVIVNSFERLKALSVIQTTNFSFLEDNINDVDFIFISDYSENRHYNDNTFLDFRKLKKINPFFGVVHLFGRIEAKKMDELSIPLYPYKNGYPQKMTYALDYIGPNPIIGLQSAGLKVGSMILDDTKGDLAQPINY